MIKCRICGASCSGKYELRGTMYGTEGKYKYYICDECGCMQIEEVPQDISIYYNSDKYYSLNMDKRRLKNELLYHQLENQIGHKNFWGSVTQFLYPVDYSCFSLVDHNAYILDVGCGDGELLRWLAKAGYKHIEGIDPFSKDYQCEDYCISAKDICDYMPKNKFELITMYHVLEHLDRQHEVISKAVSLLIDGGYLAIMIPYFSNYYWNKYADTLYTLDPPRHLYIHTKKSILHLFEGLGMILKYFNTEFDPGIPEMAANISKGHTENNNGSTLIKSTLVSITSRGLRKKLKKEEDGAIATFVFQKQLT